MRRGAWSRVAAAGVALAVASVACSSGSGGAGFAGGDITHPDSAQTCLWRVDGTKGQRITVEADGGTLDLWRASDLAAHDVLQSSLVVEIHDQLFLRAEVARVADEEVRASIHYGESVQGVHSIELRIKGDSVAGQIDGRDLRPFAKPADASQMAGLLAFADGSPVPVPTITADDQQTLADLLTQLQTKGQPCATGENKAPPPALSVEDAPTNSIPGQQDDPQHSFACQLCLYAVDGAFLGCLGGVAAACASVGPLYPLCVGLGILGCYGIAALGYYECEVPGGSLCCPHTCGSACCDIADSCLNNNGLCCPADTNPCNGVSCCKSDGSSCMANGQCCPAGDEVCNGSECCNTQGAGEHCLYPTPDSASQTCTTCSNAVCQGTCCNAGQACANGQCCAAASACNVGQPNETCCSGDAFICTNPTLFNNPIPGQGQCCTPQQACNGNTYCCGDGMSCVKPDPNNAETNYCCPTPSACGTFCCNGGPTADRCALDGETLAPTCGGSASICGGRCCNAAAGQSCKNIGTGTDPVYTCCSDAEFCQSPAGGPGVCCLQSLHQTCALFPTPHCVPGP